MKKIRIVILFVSISSYLYAMDNRKWIDNTGSFLKNKGIQRIIQSGALEIPLVTTSIQNIGDGNLFLLLIYPNDDPNKEHYASFTDQNYRSFQQLSVQLRSCITRDWLVNFNVISCQYAKNNELVPKALAILMHQLKQSFGVIATYAFGESAHIVNLATQAYEKDFAKNNRNAVIDAIIHVQSPIYEYSWSWLKRSYQHNQEWSPTCFRKLYHFYTKAALPLYNTLIYPDRKYRQQIKENMTFDDHVAVKNIRMLKENDDKLVDMSVEEIKSKTLVDNFLYLLTMLEKYTINFDFIAKGSDENNQERPVLMINRPVVLEQHGDLVCKYGDKRDQSYKFGSTTHARRFAQICSYEQQISKNSFDALAGKFKDSFTRNKDLVRLGNELKKDNDEE